MHEAIDTRCMDLHISCMLLKPRRQPKVQRGLSLTRELYERIAEEADKYGRTWNETAELILARAFSSLANSRKSAEDMRFPVSDELVALPEEGEVA